MLRGNGGIIGPANIPTISTARGVWSLAEQYLAQRQGIWPAIAPTTDPLFYYTSLLLPGQNTPGQTNNQFLDSGTANGGVGFPITRNGNTTQGTFSPFSQTGWGNYFDGTNAYLTSSHPALNATFTIEAWVYRTSGSALQSVVFLNGGGVSGVIVYIDTSNYLICNDGSTGQPAFSNLTVPINTWAHIAVVRSGGTTTGYVNGTVAGSHTFTPAAVSAATIARYVPANPIYFPGYISNVRVVNGTAVYTGAFTPPSLAPLTTAGSTSAASYPSTTNVNTSFASSETSLLTCQSNRFIDNSTNNFTITRNGNTSVVAFSPFNPTASWSAATYGGSGYFDGSGDYLTGTNNSAYDFGSGDFTIEAFAYPTTASQLACCARGETTGFSGFILSTTNFLATTNGSSWDISISFTTALTANAWNHVALVRNGNVYTAYLNGVANGTTTVSGTIVAGTAALTIGRRAGQTDYSGYLSSLRLVKGTAVYTGAFTPPTAPLTAITNTSLLLNFTNAGIYDASSRVLFETVNSASISNAITPKWGTTSMKFASSTSDYLWTNNQTAQVETFGTGDFTIDGWFYLSTVGTAFGIISRGTSTTGWSVNITSGQKLQFSYTTSNLTGATTINSGIWYYFAVVRSGSASGNLKLYLSTGGSISSADATSAGAVTDNFNQTNAIYVGADRVGTSLLNGYLQDIRMTNAARTITAAPTAAFPTKGA